ncbi:MAG: NCS1 family nucleobase:cation symporter-1 [Candidatus Dormibacteraeota bacterium]|jgi:NCS1 family nucleobase:cation symporter-1|nr:NCS1 family nucleobase:cation symporter-1 [Candidatus Dormibacteraeota bacterium]
MSEVATTTSIPGASPRLLNEDLAPAKERTWKFFDLFAMWMSDIHSIGGYTFAAGLFFLGLAAWQVLVALVLGIFLAYLGMNLTGIAGQKNGVPYPVLARISFGVFGANIPALIRAVIAIAWYGIQTYLASVAVVVLTLRIFPQLEPLTRSDLLGLSYLGWICFLIIWGLQLLVLQRGMESIRHYQDLAGPLVWVVMLALMAWMIIAAAGRINLNLPSKSLDLGQSTLMFFTAASLVVAYFSTLMLNFCDFSRFAPDRKTVIVANFFGLPINFTAFAIVSVVVTAGTIAVYGKAIFDPVEIVARVPNTAILILGAVTFTVATIGINIVANFVSPAYDLANAMPKYINFKRGGLIAAVVSILVMPWRIFANPVAVNYFLGGLGALLGPLFGIIFTDYFLVRRQQVNVEALFQEGESKPYWYTGGVNPKALVAFLPAAAISIVIALVPALSGLAAFSWFIGAALGAAIYAALNFSAVARPAQLRPVAGGRK